MSRGSLLYRWRQEIFSGLLGGLILAMSFPPFPTRLLSIAALVPLLRYFLVVFPSFGWRKGALKRGFLTGYLFGIAFFSLMLYWVANLVPASNLSMPWVMIPAIVLLVMYLSLFPGLFAFLLAWFVRRFGTRALFAAPALWALTEFMRSSGELAFSWGLISSALVPYPLAMQGLSFYGPFGFSMIMVLANVLVTFLLFAGTYRRRAWALTALVLIAGIHLSYGAFRISGIDRDEPGKRSARVAVVQPNVDLAFKWNPEHRDSILTQVESLTKASAGDGAVLVIFPETAVPVSISHSTPYRRWLKKIAAESKVDLFIGYINHIQDGGQWRAFNACGLIDRSGNITAEYHKINLLPLGERIPFSQYIPALEKIDFGQANFRKGTTQTVFDSSAGKFGALICFESTFSDYARRYVREGAEFLVNVTNDGWFGSARGPLQHAETAVLRAVENGVTLVRSANTGVSMAVDPAGRVSQSIGLNKEGVLMVPVKLIDNLTFYCRYGQLSFFVMFFANLFVFLLPALFHRPGPPGAPGR